LRDVSSEICAWRAISNIFSRSARSPARRSVRSTCSALRNSSAWTSPAPAPSIRFQDDLDRIHRRFRIRHGGGDQRRPCSIAAAALFYSDRLDSPICSPRSPSRAWGCFWMVRAC